LEDINFVSHEDTRFVFLEEKKTPKQNHTGKLVCLETDLKMDGKSPSSLPPKHSSHVNVCLGTEQQPMSIGREADGRSLY